MAVFLATSFEVFAADQSGTAETVTFEGLVQSGGIDLHSYDGFNWSNVSAVAKHSNEYHRDPGFHAVLHGRVAGLSETQSSPVVISVTSGKFSFVSGHFAGAPTGGSVTFYAYRQGVQVGEYDTFINPADTTISFDQTFHHVDQVQIFGQSLVAMDNLHVRFYSQ
jgi:hypothetical protein